MTRCPIICSTCMSNISLLVVLEGSKCTPKNWWKDIGQFLLHFKIRLTGQMLGIKSSWRTRGILPAHGLHSNCYKLCTHLLGFYTRAKQKYTFPSPDPLSTRPQHNNLQKFNLVPPAFPTYYVVKLLHF